MHYIALDVNNLLFVSPDLNKMIDPADQGRPQMRVQPQGSCDTKFILGMQVHHCLNGRIFLSQRTYLKNYADGEAAPTPMQPNLQFAVAPEGHQPTPAFRSRYLQANGSLMYAMLGTWPHLCAVGVLGLHAARPDNSHSTAVVRVLVYIKGTLNSGLESQLDNLAFTSVEVYSDSDLVHAP